MGNPCTLYRVRRETDDCTVFKVVAQAGVPQRVLEPSAGERLANTPTPTQVVSGTVGEWRIIIIIIIIID